MKEEDDFGFIRNYLDRELAENSICSYEVREGDEIRVANRDLEAVREAILAPKFNFGAPRVAAVEIKLDGGLVLAHEHSSDGRGLDTGRAKVLEYTRRVWRRPVRLHTVNDRGENVELTAWCGSGSCKIMMMTSSTMMTMSRICSFVRRCAPASAESSLPAS